MGDEATGVLGVWLLRSAYIERVDNRERSLLFGDDPRGVLILHESGRMAAILTPSHQPGDPPAIAKAPRLFRPHRIEPPNRFVTDVDIAWIPSWVGTPRPRTFTLRDGALDIVTDPAPFDFLGGAMVVSVLTWVREDAKAARDAAHV
jgi:Lipocalin-like domain